MEYLSPAGYLPHDAPMMLLETVESVTNDGAACSVTVSGRGVLAPFLNADGDLPGWFALELMAQTVGVWCEWHRLQKGLPHSPLGMVLGARELVCAAGLFTAGTTLTITIERLMQDERFGSFECVIHADNASLATGRVNTFQPSEEELTSLFNQGTPS
ncbi:3-hydroxy-fatty acyl-ACP dehydratase [Enterobacter quasimori]|uniref:3-hydroxy-fatty acyl-ACP dehydratase n=1 Tax=Enterobacter quasimori TaxID=2838947 RepID=A0ABY0AR84_9ENTR|nr:3-hydroxy-fatty acyl-ACP dehydratase [Enterobacter quasimori]MBT1730273.1 3-hydroxy-fatty acyl-ACP dehydratase [Enterobacter quasimori]RTN22301.1 3-hydroxy-fatty acyl-ACP dehydratase [Enterobacter quasimori]